MVNKIKRELVSFKNLIFILSYIALWNGKLDSLGFVGVVGAVVYGKTKDYSTWATTSRDSTDLS